MKKITTLLVFLFILTSCQSAKDAFTLKKKSNADEFLVEKKNPLVLPPEYGKLPIPSDQQVTKESSEGTDIKSLVGNEDKASSSKKEKKTLPTSIEKSILEKIK
jgi:uncharacterized protein YcfL